MSVATSVHPILEAAEQAAAAGDIAAAGELLRRALQLQETDLGPHHPDLANTLNNLGVVCEKTGRLDEAEGCYRRAYEIAATAFEADHPFVITSRKNLAEFGEAHGRAIEPLPATAAAASAPAARPEVIPPPPMEPPRREDVPPASKHQRVPIALLTIGLIAVLVLGVIVMRRSNRTPASTPPDPPLAATTPVESASTRDTAVDSTTAAAADAGAAAKKPAPSREAARPGSARGAAQPTVAEAQVCRRFSATGSPDWRCEPAGSSVAPGSLVYYTRIKAPRATTVEHRWYHGDDLQQRVVLDVAANPTAGYRTYSRLAVSAAGRWRVELRTTSGMVLHEERFNVR